MTAWHNRTVAPAPFATHTAIGEAQAVPDTAPIRGHGERVLVVEDDRPLRLTVALLLRVLNYTPLPAEDSRAALRVLESEPVDLLFTDLLMPGGMDGLALACFAAARSPGLHVLLTSGLAGGVAREMFGVDLDQFPLLEKPYRMHELARMISDALNGARTETASDQAQE